MIAASDQVSAPSFGLYAWYADFSMLKFWLTHFTVSWYTYWYTYCHMYWSVWLELHLLSDSLIDMHVFVLIIATFLNVNTCSPIYIYMHVYLHVMLIVISPNPIYIHIHTWEWTLTVTCFSLHIYSYVYIDLVMLISLGCLKKDLLVKSGEPRLNFF